MKNELINGINFKINAFSGYSKTILLLAPGASSSDFFDQFYAYLPQDALIIAPDYPSRGLSKVSSDNSIYGIAKSIDECLNIKETKNITVIGLSFGTQVAIELVKRSPLKYKKIILIAPGPFFGELTRKLLATVFYMPTKLPQLLGAYRKVILSLGMFSETEFPAKNLMEMNLQWLNTIGYNLHNNLTLELPLTTYTFTKDIISKRDSQTTLTDIFNNHKEIKIKGGHPRSKNDYLKIFQSQSFLENL